MDSLVTACNVFRIGLAGDGSDFKCCKGLERLPRGLRLGARARARAGQADGSSSPRKRQATPDEDSAEYASHQRCNLHLCPRHVQRPLSAILSLRTWPWRYASCASRDARAPALRKQSRPSRDCPTTVPSSTKRSSSANRCRLARAPLGSGSSSIRLESLQRRGRALPSPHDPH